MGPLLHDGSCIQDGHPIGALDRTEAMGDDQGGAPLHESLEGLLDQVFALGIQGTGGLVENEDGRILEKGPSDRDALFLMTSWRESHTPLADQGVGERRGIHDEIVGIGGLRGGLDVFFSGLQSSVADVVPDGGGEENGHLGSRRPLGSGEASGRRGCRRGGHPGKSAPVVGRTPTQQCGHR